MDFTKRLAQNSFIFTSALFIQKILSSVYFWYYSNNLPGGANDLGLFNYIQSYTALFFIVGDLGLYLVFLRESAKDWSKANQYLNTLLVLKLPLFALTAIVTITTTLISQPANIWLVIAALSWLMIDNLTLIFYAVWRSHHILKFESLAVVIFEIVTMTFGIISIKLSGQIIYLLIALLIGTLGNLTFAICLTVRKLKFKIRLHFDPQIARVFLKYLPAFALTGIIVKMLNTMDVIMLRELTANYQNVGLYSIPSKIITALSIGIPTALMSTVYPVFSHLHAQASTHINRILYKSINYLLILSVPTAFGFLAIGQQVINGLWKAEYAAAYYPGRIMFFALPFIFLAFPTGNLLNAISRQKFTAISRGAGLTVLIMLNIFLIPLYGVSGVAIAGLSANIVILVFDMYFLRDMLALIRGKLLRNFSLILICSLIMFVILRLLSPYISWYYLLIIGVIQYFTVLYFVGGIDFQFVKSILNKSD